MTPDWGRLTLRGSEAVEQRVRLLLEDVREASKSLDRRAYRALLLIGGYGRGEGGVIVENGEEKPHNNLDFLLIAESPNANENQCLRADFNQKVQALARKHGIDIDFSVTNVAKLKHSPRLVIWTDMRFGHKTIAGDPDFAPNLSRYELDRIEPWDVRNLLVNRATLLVVNQHILASGRFGEDIRPLITKLVMKAVIGYGDALLFFRGRYHWSYAEKQRRMRELEGADPAFRAMYEAAADFRFTPKYEAYTSRDPVEWMQELRAQLEPVHLECERARLGDPKLEWSNYPEAAFAHALRTDFFSPRASAKKILNALRTRSVPTELSPLSQVGYRCAGTRGVSPILFPIVAYHLEDERLREIARTAFGARSIQLDELRRTYLANWGVVGDDNFGKTLSTWNISLEPADARA